MSIRGDTFVGHTSSVDGRKKDTRIAKSYNAALLASAVAGDSFKFATVFLDPESSQVPKKKWELLEKIVIGRATSPKTKPAETNGWYDSKVLSRNHAEIWAEAGKIFVKDTGSSNGTFINGERLSEEGGVSKPYELKEGDVLCFGIDINDDSSGEVMYSKVASKVRIVFTGFEDEKAASSGTPSSASPATSPTKTQNAASPSAEDTVRDVANRMWDTISPEAAKAKTSTADPTDSKKIENLVSLLKNELKNSAQSASDMQTVLSSVNEINSMFSVPAPKANEAEKTVIRNLEKERDEMKEKLRNFERVSSEYEKSNAKIAKLNEEMEASKKKADSYKTIVDTLESRITSLNSEIASLTANLTAAQSAKSQLALEIDTAKKELAGVAGKSADTEKNNGQLLAQSQIEAESLRKQLQELRQKNDSLAKEAESTVAEAGRWRERAEQAEEKLREANEKLQKISALEQENKALKEELGRTKTRGKGFFGWLAWTLGWN